MYGEAVLGAGSDRPHGAGSSSLQGGPALRGHERGVPSRDAHIRGTTSLPEPAEGPSQSLRLLPAAPPERISSVSGCI